MDVNQHDGGPPEVDWNAVREQLDEPTYRALGAAVVALKQAAHQAGYAQALRECVGAMLLDQPAVKPDPEKTGSTIDTCAILLIFIAVALVAAGIGLLRV